MPTLLLSVVLFVLHVEHVSKHHEAAAGTTEHDAKPRYLALRTVFTIQRTTSCTTQQALVAVIVEVACYLCCSARCHGCPTHQARHQQMRGRWQHCRARCEATIHRPTLPILSLVASEGSHPLERWGLVSLPVRRAAPVGLRGDYRDSLH